MTKVLNHFQETFYLFYAIFIFYPIFQSISQYKLRDDKFLSGGKFAKLDELLPKLKEDGHRVIIFSQFLFVLDILEEYLRIKDHKFLRLDGSIRSLDRYLKY